MPRLVGPVAVVMPRVLTHDLRRCCSPRISKRTRQPQAQVKTASEAVVNLLSRSWIGNSGAVTTIAGVHEQVAGLLGGPRLR